MPLWTWATGGTGVPTQRNASAQNMQGARTRRAPRMSKTKKGNQYEQQPTTKHTQVITGALSRIKWVEKLHTTEIQETNLQQNKPDTWQSVTNTSSPSIVYSARRAQTSSRAAPQSTPKDTGDNELPGAEVGQQPLSRKRCACRKPTNSQAGRRSTRAKGTSSPRWATTGPTATEVVRHWRQHVGSQRAPAAAAAGPWPRCGGSRPAPRGAAALVPAWRPPPPPPRRP